MALFVFLIDNRAQAVPKKYLCLTQQEKVGQFLKQRNRDQSAANDRFLLTTTFEQFPSNVKSGWEASPKAVIEQLTTIRANGVANFGQSVDLVMRMLWAATNRVQPLAREDNDQSHGCAKTVVIVPVLDGSELPTDGPMRRFVGDSFGDGEFSGWQVRMFSIVLRMAPAKLPANDGTGTKMRILKAPDRKSNAGTIAMKTNGQSFLVVSRSGAIDVHRQPQKFGTFGDSKYPLNNPLVPAKLRQNPRPTCWQIPKEFWPDCVREVLCARSAGHIILLVEGTEPVFRKMTFPLDGHVVTVDNILPLIQHTLGRRERVICLPVFVRGFFKKSGVWHFADKWHRFGCLMFSSASKFSHWRMFGGAFVAALKGKDAPSLALNDTTPSLNGSGSFAEITSDEKYNLLIPASSKLEKKDIAIGVLSTQLDVLSSQLEKKDFAIGLLSITVVGMGATIVGMGATIIYLMNRR